MTQISADEGGEQAGADFSSKLDLTSLALVFPGRDASEPTRCWVYSWLLGDSVARRMHETLAAGCAMNSGAPALMNAEHDR